MTSSNRSLLGGFVASLLLTVLTACGGGSGSSTTSSATSSTASTQTTATNYTGPITGFGSVVVNGMRFDVVGAAVATDDDAPLNASDLRLGSIVHVNGKSDDSAAGTASTITLTPALLGKIDSVDTPRNALIVLKQKVIVNDSTNYYDKPTASYITADKIVAGDYVEVHGLVQADGSFLATLIERRTAQALYRVRGQISNLDTNAKTFAIGALTVNYNAAAVTGALINAAWIRVKATTEVSSSGVLAAAAVRVQTGDGAGGLVAGVASTSTVKLKGVATGAPVSNTITLAGLSVNLANASYQGGSASAITTGTALEVKGTWDGTKLQASVVEFEGHRTRTVNGGGKYELYGAVTSFTSKSNFVVQGVTVNASNVTSLPASLAVGTYLEIKGNMTNGVLVATSVQSTTSRSSSGDDNSGRNYEIYGTVSNYASLADFYVGGVRVNASGARFEHGSASAISNGRFIEAKGSTNASGIFIATKVEMK